LEYASWLHLYELKIFVFASPNSPKVGRLALNEYIACESVGIWRKAVVLVLWSERNVTGCGIGCCLLSTGETATAVRRLEVDFEGSPA
jgi:hypothetical protein